MSEREYRVRWEIDVIAASPYAAAVEARTAQTRPGTIATAFEVEERGTRGPVWQIDLSQPAERWLVRGRRPIRKVGTHRSAKRA